MVWSMAARKSSSVPMSLTATWAACGLAASVSEDAPPEAAEAAVEDDADDASDEVGFAEESAVALGAISVLLVM
jgi:hypothetical protein